MPTQRLDNLGGTGLVTDLHPTAQDGWRSCENVIPRNGRISTAPGESKLFDLAIAPRWYTHHRQPDGTDYLVVCNGTSVYAYTMDGTGEDISPTTGGSLPFSEYISFCNLNGVLVWNSAATGPHYWPGPGSPLTELPGWDHDDWRCRTMAAYRYYLVAGGITENVGGPGASVFYGHKVMWSNAAEDGAVPTLWVADPTNEAGDDLLGESLGEILGMTPVQDSLWIIKDDSVYSMDWVGLPFVMQTRRLRGALNLHSIQGTGEYLGSLVALSGRDLVVFDGAQIRSLVKGRVQEALITLIGNQPWRTGAVYLDPYINRLYLLGKATYINQFTEALVLDLDTQAWGRKRLGFIYGMVTIPYAKGPTAPEVTETIVLESNEANTAYWASILDATASSSLGVPYSSSVVRDGIALEGAEGLAMLTEAWVEATGAADTLQAYIGAQWTLDDSIRWDGPHTVTPNRETHINPRITGRYFALRFESANRQNWQIGSTTLRWSPAGER
jgi:hypothetical protein